MYFQSIFKIYSKYISKILIVKYLQKNECLKLWSTRLVSNMSFFGCGKCSRDPLHCRIISIRIDSAIDTPYTRNELQEGHDNDPANHIGIFSIPIKKLFTHRWQWLPSGQLWDYHWIDYWLMRLYFSKEFRNKLNSVITWKITLCILCYYGWCRDIDYSISRDIAVMQIFAKLRFGSQHHIHWGRKW